MAEQTFAPELSAPTVDRKRTRSSGLWRIARQKPIGAIAALVCILLVVIAVLADVLAPYEPQALGHPRLSSPSWDYPFGTDNLFRDMLSRIIVGTRISIGIGHHPHQRALRRYASDCRRQPRRLHFAARTRRNR